MGPDATGHDKFGRYSLTYRDRILIAQVQGAIGLDLTQGFCNDIQRLIQSISDKHWGYLGAMPNCEGFTEQAEHQLPDINRSGMQRGCLVDAYVLNSALARAQIKKIREAAGIKVGIEQCLFDNETDAVNFIHQQLEQIDNKKP